MSTSRWAGMVQMSGGYWVLQDADASGWEGELTSVFAGAAGQDGLDLVSGRYGGEIAVAVETHDSAPPTPGGWEKVEEVVGNFPSREAAAFCQEFLPREELREIRLPSEWVTVWVMVNGWRSPPTTGSGSEEWLLHVWPADG